MSDFDSAIDVAVVDIGVSNIASVTNALFELGYNPIVVSESQSISRAQRLILPGNGSFRVASERLFKFGWIQAINEFALTQRPILGICLGMQMLASFGEEDGISEGLNLIPGVSRRLSADGLRLPHVGWNAVNQVKAHIIFDGIKQDRDFYFSNSYALEPTTESCVVGKTEYGATFTSVVGSRNVVGVQFHPEKSQKNGLKLLSQFMKWDGKAE